MSSVLKVNNLTKKFDSGFWPLKQHSYVAVNDISFQLNKGEILGFLGPNGAGKTTTIQMLLDTLNPSSGSISYFGIDFKKNRIDILKKIGHASGFDKLPARLTIYENLDIVGRIYQLSATDRVERIKNLLSFFDIWDLRNRQTGTLSAGQATRVLLAKAFIASPEIVLLDEPTAALDPDVAREVRKFIMEQSEQYGTSVLITSHNMHEVTQLCDRVLVLKNGTIIADNTPETLASSISQVRIHLIIANNIERVMSYARENRLPYTTKENNITIEIDEHRIAQLLGQLSIHNVEYSYISIDKPTLEDYFLSIAK